MWWHTASFDHRRGPRKPNAVTGRFSHSPNGAELPFQITRPIGCCFRSCVALDIQLWRFLKSRF